MKTTQRPITPHLWFEKDAAGAARFYAATFPNSRVTGVTTLQDTPSGSVDIASFDLMGQPFTGIGAGPLFQFNPSISFHVRLGAKDEIDAIWEYLSRGGVVLMELGEYPFSERYGWVQDRYGLSWQLMYVNEGEITQSVTPVLLYAGEVCGRAEEAVNFYTSVFAAQAGRGASQVGQVTRYGRGEPPDSEGTLKYATFKLFGQEFGALDSAHAHQFAFNEAISFMVYCDTQDEIDDYWGKLSAVPEAEQCGWLKDRFGVSWQIVPAAMHEMMAQGSKEQIERVTQAFLQMKKFDLALLEKAYEG